MNYKRFCFFLLSLCLGLSLQAQIESRLTYRRYTTQDGLPQLQTERLFQDSRGYIYIGTLSGFVRFDGQALTHFLKGRRYNIVGFTEVDGAVRALDFRRQWVTSHDDVEMKPIDPEGRWLLNNLNSGSLPMDYVLLEDEQEQNRRLCRVTPDGFLPVIIGELLDRMTPDRKLYLDNPQATSNEAPTVYVPTESGLWMITQPSTWQARKVSDKNNMLTLLRTNKQLLAFAPDGIYTVGNRGVSLKTAFNFKATADGLIVRETADGHLLIADEHTLYEYDGTSIKEVATGFNLVKDMLVDKWDRLWLATYEGLYCFFNRHFTNHVLTDRDDIVRAVGADGNGQLVMGTLNGKLLVWPKGESDVQKVEDSPENFFAPNAATIGNKVYMAGNGDIACYDGSLHWLHLPQDRYQFVAEAGGRLIIGSRRCISAYDPQTGKTDTLSTETPYPWCAAEDAQGRLWIGSTFGLFADGHKTDYPQKLIVTAMERDTQGNILFASKDSLFLIRQGQITPLTIHNSPLTTHEIRSIHVSPRGYLVVAVIDGLFVSRISHDYAISDTHFFNQQNGFTALEPLMATMAETDDGTVWLPCVEEMTSFRPAELLALAEEETYISPPLRWWQHWWVWIMGLLLLSLLVWAVAYRYEKLRNRRRMIRLQREKLQREQQIKDIREKAAPLLSPQQGGSPEGAATPPTVGEGWEGTLKDIVRITEKNYNEHLTFRTASGTIVAEVKDIAFFKGDGNYSQIVTFHDKDTVLVGLGALEKMLSPEVFVRADRSTLVNIHLICTLLPKQRRCIFRSPEGKEVDTTLLAPAFKRLQELL